MGRTRPGLDQITDEGENSPTVLAGCFESSGRYPRRRSLALLADAFAWLEPLTDKMAVMTTARQDQDFATLLAAIAGFPGGASLAQVTVAARLPISERTLI